MTGMTDISRHGGDRKNRDERDIKVKDDALVDPELLAATSGCLMQADNLVDDSDDDDGYDFDNAGPGMATKVVQNGFKLFFFPLILAYRGVMSLKHLPWLFGRILQGVKQGPGAILRIGPFFKSLFSPTGRLGKTLVLLGTVTGVIWVSRKVTVIGASWSAKRKARRMAAEEATLEAEIRAEETAAKTSQEVNAQSHQTHAGHSQHGHSHSGHGHRKVTATVHTGSSQQQPDTVTFSSQLQQQQQQSQTAQPSSEPQHTAVSADDSGHGETRESRKKFGFGKLNKFAAAFKRSEPTASDDAASPNDSVTVASKPEKTKWRWSKRDKTATEDAHDPFAESGSRWSAKKSALFAAACLVLLIGGFSVARQVMQKGDDVALNTPDDETPVTNFGPDDAPPAFASAAPKNDGFPSSSSASEPPRNTIRTSDFLTAQQNSPPSSFGADDSGFSNQVPTMQLPAAPDMSGEVPTFTGFGQFGGGGNIADSNDVAGNTVAGNGDTTRFHIPDNLPVPGTPGGMADDPTGRVADSLTGNPTDSSLNESSHVFADNAQNGRGTAMHISVTAPPEETPYEEIPIAGNRTPAAPASTWASGAIANGHGDGFARDGDSVAFDDTSVSSGATTEFDAYPVAPVHTAATPEPASSFTLAGTNPNAAVPTPTSTATPTLPSTEDSNQFALAATPRTPQNRGIATTPEYNSAAQSTPRSDSFSLGSNDATPTQLQSSTAPTVRENTASLADIYASSQTSRNAGNPITTGSTPISSNSTGLASPADESVEQDGWDSAPEPQITRQTESFSRNAASAPASAEPFGEIQSQSEQQPLAHTPSGGGFSFSQNAQQTQDTFANAGVEPRIANNSSVIGSNASVPFAENPTMQTTPPNGGSFALTPQATPSVQQQIQQPTQYADASTPTGNAIGTFNAPSVNAQPPVTGAGRSPVSPNVAANTNSPAVLPLPEVVHDSLNAGVVSPSQQIAAMPMVSQNTQTASNFSPPVLAQADTPAPSYATQSQPLASVPGQTLHGASQQVAGPGGTTQAATIQPLTSGVSTGVYIVQPGDNIYKIAKQELGSVKRYREIYELNRDRIPIGQDTLTAGMELLLPNM